MADKVKATIERKLRGAFAPSAWKSSISSCTKAMPDIAPAAGHFRVTMDSDRFDGLSRLARQRLVHDDLADELAGPVHALSLRLKVRTNNLFSEPLRVLKRFW